MTTRVCRYCGEEQELETGFSRNGYTREGKQRFHWTCKKCWSRIRTKKKKPVARAVPDEWLDKADKLRPKVCHGQCKSMKELGRCIHIQCRYHMIDMVRNGGFHGGLTDQEILDLLMGLKYTCLWELMEKEKTPLTQEEIADILGVTKQRVAQIEWEAIDSMRKKGPQLEDFLAEDVSNLYQKPMFMKVKKLSEQTIVPVWHPNFFVQPEKEE